MHFTNGSWVGMWTPTIHDIRIHDNFYAPTGSYNNGTNVVMTNNTRVSNGDWPPAAKEIIKVAGLPRELRANRSRLDDFDLSIEYRGAWIAPGFRGLGDFHETVHAAHNNGDSATMTFTGASVRVIGEKNSDQGDIEVFIDEGSVAAANAARSTAACRLRADSTYWAFSYCRIPVANAASPLLVQRSCCSSRRGALEHAARASSAPAVMAARIIT